MTERNLPICVRPNCTRAQPGYDSYDGLCFRHAKAAGIAHHYVPWEKVNTELERILSGGWTLNAIEEDHGIFAYTLRDIKYHRRDHFRHSTYQTLKEIPTLSPYRRPAWPLRRRVNAMRAIGIPFSEMAREMGADAIRVQHLSYERAQWAPIYLDKKIRAYYTQHALDPIRNVDRATARLALPKPFDWNDIDDPNETPRVSNPQREKPRPLRKVTPAKRQLLKEIVEHYGVTNAAKILKLNFNTMKKIMTGDTQKVNPKIIDRINYRHKKIPTNLGQAA